MFILAGLAGALIGLAIVGLVCLGYMLTVKALKAYRKKKIAKSS